MQRKDKHGANNHNRNSTNPSKPLQSPRNNRRNNVNNHHKRVQHQFLNQVFFFSGNRKVFKRKINSCISVNR